MTERHFQSSAASWLKRQTMPTSPSRQAGPTVSARQAHAGRHPYNCPVAELKIDEDVNID